jgi:hypothetical protein
MNAEQLSRAKNILSGDDVESQVGHILNHRNRHEMIDYIDGVQPSEDYEYFYTVSEFILTVGIEVKDYFSREEVVSLINEYRLFHKTDLASFNRFIKEKL